jgi:hypothetical protein
MILQKATAIPNPIVPTSIIVILGAVFDAYNNTFWELTFLIELIYWISFNFDYYLIN